MPFHRDQLAPPIGRDEQAELGADVEQVLVLRIFLDHVDRAGGQVAADRAPGVAEIGADVRPTA